MKIYTFNNKVLTRNSKWLKEYEEPTPPTPSLPPYTIRMRFTTGIMPEFSKGTATQISSSPNVWDLTYENSDWTYLFSNQAYLIEVIDANTTGVINMEGMFQACDSLTSVPLFDTSSVISMWGMFKSNTELTSIPLFDTSSATYTSNMFRGCYKVETGALALYQQMSTQATPPSEHDGTFYDCGIWSVTGAAELAQIPSDWGGTGN